MWLHNNLNTTKVQAYNEKPIVRGTGGLSKREDYDTLDLRILIIPEFGRFRQRKEGRFEELILHFQVSKSELKAIEEVKDKDEIVIREARDAFSIEIGKTHIIRNNIDYKVVRVQDASFMAGVQLYDCFAKRIMPVEKLI